jgi:hypothetical protein
MIAGDKQFRRKPGKRPGTSVSQQSATSLFSLKRRAGSMK